MIVAERKPFAEIGAMLAPYKKVLIAGCGTCVAVCLTGGEKEVGLLAAELAIAARIKGNYLVIQEMTVERQCDREFLEEMKGPVAENDSVLSLACGAGIVSLPAREDPNFGLYGLEAGRKILSLAQLETLLRSPAYREKLLPKNRTVEVAFLVGLSTESWPGVVGRALTLARTVQDVSDHQSYFLSGNMKVAGDDLERIYARAPEEGILFFRFDQGRPQIKDTGQGLEITFQNEILGRLLALRPDIIVVDERLMPHPELKALAGVLGIPLDAAGFMAPDQVFALPVRPLERAFLP